MERNDNHERANGAGDLPEAAVKTIDRAARLLRAFRNENSEGAMLSELSRKTCLGKGTTHRLLAALVDVGFVYQDQATRRYRLGFGLASLTTAAFHQEVTGLARPALLRLAQATADTVFASVREGTAAVCVAREIGSFPIRTLSLDVGHRRPLGVGSGSLALLAFLNDEEIAEIIRKNERWCESYPGFSPAELTNLVSETRKYGFSYIDGRVVPGMHAIGVSVLDARGIPLAALSIAGISDRIGGDRIAELVNMLKKEAAYLTELLEKQVPPEAIPSENIRSKSRSRKIQPGTA